MYYHPSSTSSPWQFYNLYPYPRAMSVNPYFYPYVSFSPRAFEELWQGYNNSLRGGIHLPGNHGSPIYWTTQTGTHGAYGGIPSKWTPLGWERNQLGYPNGPQRDRPLPFPIPRPPQMDAIARDKARKTIENKWKSLGGAPGKSISSSPFAMLAVEKVGGGYRIRYENGAIYTQNISGPAYWVHGAIGQKYEELGGVGSWLGFPITDELPLDQEGGRVSRFEKGEIYWWNDTGPIEFDEVVLAYTGIHCFGETDLDDFLGAGSDEVYATISIVAPTGNAGSPLDISTSMTRLYTGVDGGESFPDHIDLYRGKPFGLNITFILFEHDKGDPNAYYQAVKSSVQAAAAGLTAGIGALTGPLVAGIAGPLLQGLVPVVAQEINIALGSGEDLIGQATIPLTIKQVVLLAARTGESVHNNQISFKLETPLLTGEGSSYKGYFSLNRAPK